MADLFDTLQKETEQDVSELKVVKFVPTTYHDVEFERQPDVNMWGTYDEGLAALRKRGYDRHPRSSEVFTLLADSLKRKLSPNLEDVAENVCYNLRWIWCSLAWERKGNLLIAYLDPEGLVWSDSYLHYVKRNFHCTSKHFFDVGDKKSPVGNPLSEFSDDFVHFHYGRTVVKLPRDIQQHGLISLPYDNGLWPVSYGNYGYNIACRHNNRVSCGVCTK